MPRIVPLERLDDLGNHAEGLDSARIQSRQQQYGSNQIIEIPATGGIYCVQRLKTPCYGFCSAPAHYSCW